MGGLIAKMSYMFSGYAEKGDNIIIKLYLSIRNLHKRYFNLVGFVMWWVSSY